MNQNSKSLRITPFVFGVFTFLLPFIEISCSGQKIVSFTGLQLVMGTQMQSLFGGAPQKVSPELFAIISFLCFIGGIIVALKAQQIAAKGMAFFSAGSLISLFFLKMHLDGEIIKNAPLTIDYVSGFWLAFFGGLSGLFFGLYLMELIPLNKIDISNLSKTHQNSDIPYVEAESKEIGKSYTGVDLIFWIKKNKILLGFLIIIATSFICVYKVFIELDPIRDGKNAATLLYSCTEKYNNRKAEEFESFLKFLDRNAHITYMVAKANLNTIITNLDNENQKNFNDVNKKITTLKSRYIGDDENIKKYDLAFNEQTKLLSNNMLNDISIPAEKIQQKIDALESAEKTKDINEALVGKWAWFNGISVYIY